MSTVRRRGSDAEIDALLADYRARAEPTEEQIEAWAIEDDSVLTDEDLANMEPVYPPPPPPGPDELRALRIRLALSQLQFAHQLGFGIDEIRQYEEGDRIPSGPAATLLSVIAAEPEAVARALRWGQADRERMPVTPASAAPAGPAAVAPASAGSRGS